MENRYEPAILDSSFCLQSWDRLRQSILQKAFTGERLTADSADNMN
jgi:hypothetical protein